MSANRVYKSETGFTRKIYLAITSIVDCTQYTTYAMHSSLAHLRVLPVEENHVQLSMFQGGWAGFVSRQLELCSHWWSTLQCTLYDSSLHYLFYFVIIFGFVIYIIHVQKTWLCFLTTLHCLLYILHFIHYTVYFTLYTLYSTHYTVHITLYTLYCTLFTAHFRVYMHCLAQLVRTKG